MIGYVSLGTNDLARATAFYDALLAEVGAQTLHGGDLDGYELDVFCMSAG